MANFIEKSFQTLKIYIFKCYKQRGINLQMFFFSTCFDYLCSFPISATTVSVFPKGNDVGLQEVSGFDLPRHLHVFWCVVQLQHQQCLQKQTDRGELSYF